MSQPITVAIDVTPLAGNRTGIARSIIEVMGGLALIDDGPRVQPYAISTRARQERDQLPESTRTIPGAGALVKMWSRRDKPRIDWAFGDANVLYATNYLVPPSRLPTVIAMYDCSMVRHRSLCSPQVQALEPIVRRAIHAGAVLHVPSQFVANECEEIFGPGLRAANRIHVIALGVPSLPPALGVPAELARFGAIANGVPYLLAVGTLEPRKNLAHLVAAFAPVAARHADLRLVLAGADGSARPEIDSAISRLHPDIAARVVLTGPLGEPAKGWLVRNALALAYPSVYEGFGFPMLEAMSVGVPVIAARSGSIPEVAGDAALLVEATNETMLTEAITNCVEDDTIRTSLISKGFQRVTEFSWIECARELHGVFSSLVH